MFIDQHFNKLQSTPLPAWISSTLVVVCHYWMMITQCSIERSMLQINRWKWKKPYVIKITLTARASFCAKFTCQIELRSTMTFKERLKEFSQDTSMHGAKYVGKENSHWIKRQVVAFMIVFKILHSFSELIFRNISKIKFYRLCNIMCIIPNFYLSLMWK